MTHPLAADLDQVAGQVGPAWAGLRGARVFLTGGTGFFGCWLLESLLWANDHMGLGAQVVVLTRDPESFRRKSPHLAGHPAVALHAGDVRTFDFPAGRFTHVIHAATEASAAMIEERPLEMLDTIVDGTRRALDFAQASGAGPFLLASSGAVYGRQPPEVAHLTEDFAGAPDVSTHRSAYGEGKRVAELLCAAYAREGRIQPKIARCFAFVGPYLPLDRHFAVGNFIRDALKGGPIEIKGDGTPCRSYLYAGDLAAWLWVILIHGKPCRPYNVGSETSLSISELARTVCASIAPGAEVRIAQAPKGAPPERYIPSTRRAREELGLQCTVNIEDAIRRTARFAAERR